MTRKGLINKTELLRMAKVAKEFGVVVERELDGVIVRVLPPKHVATSGPSFSIRSIDAPAVPVHPPFDHRERFAMERLVDLGVGVKTHSSGIRSFGPHSQSKLLAREYVTVSHQDGEKFKDDEISLTQKGLADWTALQSHREKYPRL